MKIASIKLFSFYILILLKVCSCSVKNTTNGRNEDLFSFLYESEDNNYVSVDTLWKKAADERINQFRKSNIQLKIDSKDTLTYEIQINQKNHNFSFGSAISVSKFLDSSISTKYREIITSYFNEVVLENDLKWQNWHYKNSNNPNYHIDSTLKTIRYLAKNNIRVRGHCLIWAPVLDYNRLERAISREKFNNKDFYIEELLRHCEEKPLKTSEFITEWDAINHLVSIDHKNRQLAEDYYGIDLYHKLYKLRNTSELKFYVNESNILTKSGKKRLAYFNRIQRLMDENLSPDGIGFMSHFEPSDLPSMKNVYNILNHFSSLKKPLKITEFDIQFGERGKEYKMSADELELQKRFTEDFMRICFSHPSMEGFIMWGFWEGAHWYPAAALWDKNWNIKPNGQAWMDLVYGEWWTQEQYSVKGTKTIQTRGFLGDYRITIKKSNGEIVYEQEHSLTKKNLSIHIVLS